jgi:hypothetical protein
MFYSSADAIGGYDMYSGPSGLFDLLDTCLVFGYTDHPPLGWTIEERSETHRVYRAPTGTARKLLRVTNLNDFTGSAFAVNVLDSINPDTNRWFTPELPTPSTPISNFWVFQKSSSPFSARSPWILFGDDKFFTLLVVNGSVSNPTAQGVHFLFFGEIDGNTYLNVNPQNNVAGNGELTRHYRTSTTPASSLFTNIDNPLLYSGLSGQNRLNVNNILNADFSRDQLRNCAPCTFLHPITEVSTSQSTLIGSRSLNDIGIAYDGIVTYSNLYFASRPSYLIDRYGAKIMAMHPHLLVVGGSAADTLFANASAPVNDRLVAPLARRLVLEGIPYIPFIVGTSATTEATFFLIRAE